MDTNTLLMLAIGVVLFIQFTKKDETQEKKTPPPKPSQPAPKDESSSEWVYVVTAIVLISVVCIAFMLMSRRRRKVSPSGLEDAVADQQLMIEDLRMGQQALMAPIEQIKKQDGQIKQYLAKTQKSMQTMDTNLNNMYLELQDKADVSDISSELLALPDGPLLSDEAKQSTEYKQKEDMLALEDKQLTVTIHDLAKIAIDTMRSHNIRKHTDVGKIPLALSDVDRAILVAASEQGFNTKDVYDAVQDKVEEQNIQNLPRRGMNMKTAVIRMFKGFSELFEASGQTLEIFGERH